MIIYLYICQLKTKKSPFDRVPCWQRYALTRMRSIPCWLLSQWLYQYWWLRIDQRRRMSPRSCLLLTKTAYLNFSTLISRAGAAILPDEHMFVQFDVSQLMQCYGHWWVFNVSFKYGGISLFGKSKMIVKSNH
jgi:hypothetical protein